MNASKDTSRPSMFKQIRDLVRQVPRGRVTTYGDIARMIHGCTPRVVGYAMAGLKPGSDVPWQRVVNRLGEISPRKGGDGDLIQEKLLELEGVPLNSRKRIDLKSCRWTGPENSPEHGEAI